MLTGINCLDFTRVLAGPLATMILGDLGANVIKVERPGSGDDTRGWGPPFDDRGESAYYLSVNRNKKSVALDFDEPADVVAALALTREAHVVIDNFRHGTLERRGIDPEQLLEENPTLIWCTITGFGEKSSRAGYDLVAQAECGWMSITGDPAGDPMKVGVALADVIAGKDAAIAILASLIRQHRAGELVPAENRRIHISLVSSATASLINVAQNALVTGADAKRWGNQHPNLVPYQLFHASDRPLVVAVGTDAQWKAFAIAVGLDELADDETLATNAGRLAQRERVVSLISESLREEPAGEWMMRLGAAGVPCGIVKTVLEVVGNAATSALTGVAPSVPGSIRLPPPRLDEHGEEIRRNGWRAFR